MPDNTTSGTGIILKSIVPDVRQFAIKGGEDTPRTPSCHIKHIVDIITCSKNSKYVGKYLWVSRFRMAVDQRGPTLGTLGTSYLRGGVINRVSSPPRPTGSGSQGFAKYDVNIKMVND